MSPVWYFYEAFIFPAKNILCLSEGGGEGREVERKNYFSILLANLLSGLEFLPTVGLSTCFSCPFLDVLTNIFQPRPFLF